MKILTADIGTGTQDIFLFDSQLGVENGFKLIVPSPTMIVHQRVKAASLEGKAILLTGSIMGGGPSHWAVQEHLQHGFSVYATPDAARTFNDDLAAVQAMGVQIIGQDEAINLPSDIERIELKDFDFDLIARTFAGFNINIQDLDLLAIAVFDHGNAPANVSDRKFRFDYLDERIRETGKLSAFAYLAEDIPEKMTRLRTAAQSAVEFQGPMVMMDTAPAAVLGALLDVNDLDNQDLMVANLGNMHTLAFRISNNRVEGLFEHHTGELSAEQLDGLLIRLADGTLRNEDVYDHHGHGALMLNTDPMKFQESAYPLLATGPRRRLLVDSKLKVSFAAPFGDMMITGCLGLLAAAADLLPDYREEILEALDQGKDMKTAPWEIS
ncbi:MAG: hypothetical protein JEZ06_15970 [Anaerolineaceae bacterium]|nr:hypothetical protein [Anaerolineaceae bacterium]